MALGTLISVPAPESGSGATEEPRLLNQLDLSSNSACCLLTLDFGQLLRPSEPRHLTGGAGTFTPQS